MDIDEFDELSGPPLSPEEIEAARMSLAQWRGPDALKIAADALAALSVVADAVAAGEISPGEGAELGKIVDTFVSLKGRRCS